MQVFIREECCICMLARDHEGTRDKENDGMWEMEECGGNGEYERNICWGKEWSGENACGARI